MADPKGILIRKPIFDVQASDIGCNRRARALRDTFEQMKRDNDKSEMALVEEIIKFMSEKPYHYNTVFGYTALLDPKKEMHTIIKNNRPANLIDDAEGWNTGLNVIEPTVVDKLQHGQMFAHTGVSDIFNYGEFEDKIPYSIHNQPTSEKLCPEIYTDMDMNVVFTFNKVKEEKKDLIWRYTIQVKTDDDSSKVTTTQGFFKLDTSMKTLLDLERDYRKHLICWIRFTVFDAGNPQSRAWFPPIRGPAFTSFELHKEPVQDIDSILPEEQIRIANLKRDVITKDRVVRYVQDEKFFQPFALTCPQLEICMKHCSEGEEHFIYSYFMQVYPMKQKIDHSEDSATKNSEAKPNHPDEPIIPRIRNSVHGYFQLCDEQPTKIMLRESWDETTLVDGKVYVYGISNITGQPVDVSALVLPDGLPPQMLLPPDQMV